MARHKNTRRAILDLGQALLQDKGYNGFSYAHIAAELGIKNAAVHYYFPAKEDLGVEVVRRYRERFRLWTNNARVKDLSPQGKLDWFFSIYTDMHADEEKVCLVGSIEAEFNTIPAPLQAEVQALHAELLAWLETALAEGAAAGVFRFRGRPAARAAVILSSLQGGLQLGRALGTERFQQVLEQLRLDLAA
jgi:AcrR family transcriptional regulator